MVPLSLLLSDLVSQRYLVPLEGGTAQRVEEMRETLDQAGQRMRSLRDKISILDLGKSLDALGGEARAIAELASEAIWEGLQAFLALVLILLVELLLLPFLSAFLIYRVLSLALRAPTESLMK